MGDFHALVQKVSQVGSIDLSQSLSGEYLPCLELVQKALIREGSFRMEPVHPSST